MMMREEVSRLAIGLFAYCILRSTSGISRAGRGEGSRARAYGAKKALDGLSRLSHRQLSALPTTNELTEANPWG